MEIIDHICNPGRSDKNNEDTWGHSGPIVWVHDGATGLARSSLIAQEGQTDAHWFVNRLNEQMKEHATSTANTAEILEKSLRNVYQEFEKNRHTDNYTDVELPMAASIIARREGEKILCTTFADCVGIIKFEDQTIFVPPCPKLVELDQITNQKMLGLMQKGVSPKRAAQTLMPHLREKRELANQTDGYNVLTLKPETSQYGILTEYNVSAQASMLLMSDGFYALVDTYKAHTNESLIDSAEANGLQYLYDELRRIEDQDNGLTLYPRFKKSDDATAVLITI